MRQLVGTTNSRNTNLGKLQEMVRARKAWFAEGQSMGLHRVEHDWVTEQQQGREGLTLDFNKFIVRERAESKYIIINDCAYYVRNHLKA